MTADLKELISKLSKVTPAEYGKLWRERYRKVYSTYAKTTSDFDTFVHSNVSLLNDLDGGVSLYKNLGETK